MKEIVVGKCSFEVVGVLQEERALFWKIHLKALIDGDLRLVRFDLAEIGIDGGIQDEFVRDHDLCINTSGAPKIAPGKAQVRRIQIQHPRRTAENIRSNLNIAVRCDGLQTSSQSFL